MALSIVLTVTASPHAVLWCLASCGHHDAGHVFAIDACHEGAAPSGASAVAGDEACSGPLPGALAFVKEDSARTAIASALEDPMISPSVDHLPFMLEGADVSATIEQRIPLSGLRTHRRQAAEAGVDRARAEAMRDMARADLDAMGRMVEGQAAVTLNQVQAARER